MNNLERDAAARATAAARPLPRATLDEAIQAPLRVAPDTGTVLTDPVLTKDVVHETLIRDRFVDHWEWTRLDQWRDLHGWGIDPRTGDVRCPCASVGVFRDRSRPPICHRCGMAVIRPVRRPPTCLRPDGRVYAPRRLRWLDMEEPDNAPVEDGRAVSLAGTDSPDLAVALWEALHPPAAAGDHDLIGRVEAVRWWRERPDKAYDYIFADDPVKGMPVVVLRMKDWL